MYCGVCHLYKYNKFNSLSRVVKTILILSIISRRNPSNFALRVGSRYTNKDGLYLATSQVIYHPLYNDVTFENDIAIIKIEEPLEFDESISPISLPDNEITFDDGDLVTVTGWGRLYVTILKIYPNFRLKNFYFIARRQLS